MYVVAAMRVHNRNLIHAVSGACGGVSAISLFYPLNMARLKLQADPNVKAKSALAIIKDILDEGGTGALYQGLWAQVVALGCSNFVYFYTYNMFKAMILRALKAAGRDPVLRPVPNLVVASTAGIINVLMTTPMWVVCTRLALQRRGKRRAQGSPEPYKGVYDCLSRIVAEEGVPALWNGTGPSLILVSNPSIQFVTYENLRGPMERIAQRRGKPITAVEFFVMGAIAKAVATVCTYPLQIAQSKLRADRGRASKPGQAHQRTYKGTLDVLQKISKAHGPRGWFKGMEAKLWQTVLTAAFQFLTYEQIAKAVFRMAGLQKGGAAARMSIGKSK